MVLFIMKTSNIHKHLSLSHIFEMFSIRCNKLDVHIRSSQKGIAPYILTLYLITFCRLHVGGSIMSRRTHFLLFCYQYHCDLGWLYITSRWKNDSWSSFQGRGRACKILKKWGSDMRAYILVPQETKMRRQTQDFVHIPFNCFAYSHLQVT